MLRKLMPRSVYDVMAAIGCFAALATGTAYAANTVFSSDIVDGEVKSVDIGNGEVGSADVKDNSLNTFDVHSFVGADVVDETLTGADIDDGSLEDQDIAQSTHSFTGDIGIVEAHRCVVRPATGINANFDHLLLTPSRNNSDILLNYTVEYSENTGNANIKVCNHTASNIDDDTTDFNLLVFDAQ